MTGLAASLFKGAVTHRIKQTFFRPAMGIMTGQARGAGGFHPAVHIDKALAIDTMAGKTKRFTLLGQQGRVITGMGAVADRAVFLGRGMGNTLGPILGHLPVAIQTKARTFLDKSFTLRRTMGQMANTATPLFKWAMQIFFAAQLFIKRCMAT